MSGGDPVLSAGVRQNLLSLQGTAELMAKTQNRLATGKRVNSALDNPSNFFTSQALAFRASDLNSLLDAIGQGQKVLEAADTGLSSITKTIETMQATIRQARQDKSFKTSSYPLAPTATGNISFSGGSIGTTPVSVALTTVTGGTTNPPTAAAITGGPFTAMNFTVTPASEPTLTAGANFTALDVADGDETYSFEISLNGGPPVTITLDSTANTDNTGASQDVIDIDEAVAAINAQLTTATSDVRARESTTSPGRLELYIASGSHTGSGASIAVGTFANGGTSPSATTDIGFGATATASGGNAGPAKTISFELDIDGAGSPTTVTIDLAAVQAVGNNDGTIDSVAELASIIDAQLGAGVTVGTAGGVLTLTSATTGASSALAITNTTATNVANTSGVSDTTVSGQDTSVTGGTTVVRTVDQLVSAINNDASLKEKIRASNDGGKLRIENLSTFELSVEGVNATTGSVDGSVGVANTAPIGGNEVRKNLVNQFNQLRDQLDKLADDASFSGVNLLRGDKLKITFNETGSSSIEIQAKDSDDNPFSINVANLGITLATQAEFDSDALLDLRLDRLVTSLNTLRSQASKFGSNQTIVETRLDFTKKLITTLQTGADNLVLADTNEEGANMLALQTRQQLSTTALSLSSQADQAVLRLFG